VVGPPGPRIPGHQDVSGLHVAVHEAARVGGVERGRDLARDRHGPLGCQGTLEHEQFLEVDALDEARRDERDLGIDARLVEREDVGVIDRRREARLGDEALPDAGILGHLGRHELERYRSPQLDLLRPVDDAHAAPAEQRLDPVAADHAPRRHRRRWGRIDDRRRLCEAGRVLGRGPSTCTIP